jgi:hypothetical protein
MNGFMGSFGALEALLGVGLSFMMVIATGMVVFLLWVRSRSVFLASLGAFLMAPFVAAIPGPWSLLAVPIGIVGGIGVAIGTFMAIVRERIEKAKEKAKAKDYSLSIGGVTVKGKK